MRGLLSLLELALAIGVPALIARLAPRRWRWPAVVLWALTPLLILLAIAASAILPGKTSAADHDKLIYGLLLIGSFLLLPWLMTCGLGFALGTMLRGRARPKAVAVADVRLRPIPAPVAFAPPIDAGGPSLSPPGGWQLAHVGIGHDDLVLDGLRVWSLTWRKETDKRVMLADPAHPTQQHEFSVFNIDDGARATRFAAAELSDGVWGFYRWLVPADAASGVTADGTLRYEHDLGLLVGGRYDSVGPVARLYDQRNAALLFDGAAWPSSRIVPQTDGSLLLCVQRGELQTIFGIDPLAGAFRDLANGEIGPLGDLPEALEKASRRAVADRIAPRRPTARNWLVALLILVGTLALIAAATSITLHLQGEPAAPHLDTIPPMPGRAMTPGPR